MRTRFNGLIAFWLPAAILCPGILWLALDRAVWPWDQAWFGAETLSLYETLRENPAEWPAALLHATPLKPPAAVWIGQFFVPLGIAIGSVDAALLLSIWLTHLAALIVLFTALMALCGDRPMIAAAGTLAAGGPPLFVMLSTQYFAEGAQTLAVAWFVLIMARGPQWTRSRRAAHLLAATAFAMLAKTTSPAFCVVPGAITLVELLPRRQSAPAGTVDRRPWAPWAVASLLTALAVAWYWINFSTAFLLVRTAAFGPVAEMYGKRDSFLGGFQEWAVLAGYVFFLRPVRIALLAVAVIAALRAPAAGSPRRMNVAAGASLLQMMVTLSVFATSPVREPRYLEALLPLLGVLVAWVALRGGVIVARGIVAVLALQLVVVETQVFGRWPHRPAALLPAPALSPEIYLVHRDSTAAGDLAAIVQRTCGPGGYGAYNFVGVDMLRLSGHALTYAAAKERLFGRAGRCRYDSLAFATVTSAEIQVNNLEYAYWIAVDPAVRPVPGYHEFLNRSAPVVFRRLRRRGVLVPEPWDGPPGIQLFRFVKR